MTRSALPALLFLLSGVLAAQDPPAEGAAAPPGPVESVPDLIALMQSREQDVESARLEMVTKGIYPGDVSFDVRGTVRVLGKTHFHISTRATFEGDLEVEREDVRTPEGVWIRENDQAIGEVYLTMTVERLAEIEAARKTLAGDKAVLDNPVDDPLGSAMLASLAEQFELQLERRAVDGVDCYVVAGPTRAPGAAGEGGMPAPDRVEILVRESDLAVMKMTQLQGEREVMAVEITALELNPELDPASFRIDLPEGAEFIDVMDHPPAAAQIRMLLEQAEQAEAGEPPSQQR
jgi:hypothetical protein